jgi:hypothetical protein
MYIGENTRWLLVTVDLGRKSLKNLNSQLHAKKEDSF